MKRALTLLLLVATAITVSARPIVAAFERFHTGEAGAAGDVEGGLLLLNELNCVACHAPPPAWQVVLPGRGKISLSDAGSRMANGSLSRFVRDPQAEKPGTTMPSVVSGDARAANEIAAYLGALRSAAPTKSWPVGKPERGRQLYDSMGCAACHAPSATEAGAATVASVPIALAQRYSREALSSFLQDPLHTRPAGRMPAFELNDAEAADLAAFLQRSSDRSQEGNIESSSSNASRANGESAFATRGCVACHDDGRGLSPLPAIALAKARLDAGCLAPRPPPGAPDFALDDAQRQALGAALRALQTVAPPAQTAELAVSRKFEALNCYACHEWRGRGGVEPVRAKLFVAAESAESLGELGRLPPKLDHAGRKLTASWLEKLLWGTGGGVRPYLSVRMPRYGREAGGALIPLLAEACRPSRLQEIDTSGTKGHQRFATGRQLIGTGENALGCVACHGLGERNPPGVRAINLTHTAERLQPEYFKALLLDPQGIQPGTIMPPLLAARKNADKEIESLWTYLKEFDLNPRLPEGLTASGDYELMPESAGRPIVFRTFLVGAGTHAIAVGFPARVHVAFDAFEVRWALTWRGRFLDATSNWEERAMPPVKPLGDAPKALAARMPLVRLAGARDAWPLGYGTSAGYVFKGYRIGPDGAPVFRYQVGGLEVEDVMRPDQSGAMLRRSVTVRGGGEGWYFYGLSADATPQRLVWQDGVARFEETLSP